LDALFTARQVQDIRIVRRLYVAFEFCEKSRKASLGDGVRAPSGCTVVGGDTAAVLMAIARAKARCYLARP